MTGPIPTHLAGAVLTVDLDAIVHNWRALRDRLNASGECGAVLKADAYGLGANKVAPVLWDAGCRIFFVALPDEGVRLRAVLPRGARIIVLNGLFLGAEADFVSQRLVPALNSRSEITAWRIHARKVGRPLPAAIHVDTGMNRLGLDAADRDALLADPTGLHGIDLFALMTHLAVADDPRNPMTAKQTRIFRDTEARFAANGLRPWASVANSAGVLLHPSTHADLARPGIALYGCAPDPARAKEQTQGLRQTIGLRARVLQVRSIDAPETVGYGANFRATRPMRIATVAAGYADGYPRSAGEPDGIGAAGFLNGYRVPQAGRISMDLMTFDITHVPEAMSRPGDWLELIGPDRDVDAVALDANTIGYEILTRLGRRFRRDYVTGLPSDSALADADDTDIVSPRAGETA